MNTPVKVEVNILENVLTERKTWYHDSEQLKIHEFRNGSDQRHGDYKEYWSNGVLSELKTYMNGKLHGSCQSWYQDGKGASGCTYFQGELHGNSYECYPNGTLREFSNYIHGKQNGRYYYYHENGAVSQVANYVNNELEGLYAEQYENGKYAVRSSYKQGKLQGCHERWWENGNPCMVAYYIDGELDGEFKYWDEHYELTRHCIYKDGNIVEDLLNPKSTPSPVKIDGFYYLRITEECGDETVYKFEDFLNHNDVPVLTEITTLLGNLESDFSMESTFLNQLPGDQELCRVKTYQDLVSFITMMILGLPPSKDYGSFK
jgi:antitoxin component YwqK of YwqJK toxin-antitoxin module